MTFTLSSFFPLRTAPTACTALAAVMLAAMPSGASAATFLTFTDRAAFKAESGPLQMETFNSVTSDIALHTAYDAGRFSMLASRTDGRRASSRIDAPPLDAGLNGTSYLNLSVWSDVESLVFNFAEGITEFGANFISGSAGGVHLLIDGQLVEGRTTMGGFFGFRSDTAFTRVELIARPGSIHHYYLDNLTFSASAVPEPATWAMMIGGFGLAGGAMRRRTPVRRAIGLA